MQHTGRCSPRHTIEVCLHGPRFLLLSLHTPLKLVITLSHCQHACGTLSVLDCVTQLPCAWTAMCAGTQCSNVNGILYSCHMHALNHGPLCDNALKLAAIVLAAAWCSNLWLAARCHGLSQFPSMQSTFSSSTVLCFTGVYIACIWRLSMSEACVWTRTCTAGQSQPFLL